jgi:SAM-dependent methyltransferase
MDGAATDQTQSNRRELEKLAPALVSHFGRARLEETAFPVYTNPFPPARYLAWRRVTFAQRLLTEATTGGSALDFGAGLGPMLPWLVARYRHVTACDLDTEITSFMLERLGLTDVETVHGPGEGSLAPFDAVVALDVLEHVSDLSGVYEELEAVTKPTGVWVISGPTENRLYRLARRVARTSGEGHVRTIHDVLEAVPDSMVRERVCRLPFGLPLFLIARYRKRAVPVAGD